MKVCTDACILGAAANLNGAERILDIGTGTGLLALMAAQRNASASIQAVEIDAAAAAQASQNAQASPWAKRLGIYAGSLAEFAATCPAPYDHILCNPPFFRHSLRSPDTARTIARHTAADTLTFAELVTFAGRHLVADGGLTVLLPPTEMLAFEQEAHRAGLYPTTRLVVRHRPCSKPLRHITEFGFAPQASRTRELAIHDADSEAYSDAFINLLRDFYLAF
ncbi:tRNA1(Val) (adenine(37)-N6)-methyltransferase [Solirubrum puertoriconensis]|uniref:tRNA1(Val) (adenine(37)-N6)-methyltransferase n=1 Tax=Solirubrum puertoriconensis TaxID=1751427 RepID=A0A9X0HKT9_SOLP1|nr:methyltransferase [Solirubrum puertoriconensis]KUG07596.1 hypothetical protein ASU33_14775 [Solirubrum puertoriconensis]